MKKEKQNDKNLILLLIIAFLFIITTTYIIILLLKQETYDEINKNELLSVQIIANEDDINKMYENPELEEYIRVDVIINGKKITNCGFRTKGSSAYKVLEQANNTTKHGYRLELDYYNKNQSYNGIKKFYLNNNILDPTYLKEMIAFDIYEEAGVPTPVRAYTELSINDKNDGIYTIVEIPEEAFLIRNYGYDYGILYKPKITEEYAPENEKSLVYKDDNLDSYPVIKYCEKYGRTFTQTEANNLIASLKAISENNMEEYVDIDSVLDYLMVSFFIPNDDSYISKSFRNFYIYQEDKKITLLPYDLNLYFRYTEFLNQPILNYDKYITTESKPLIYNLLSNQKYQEQYKQKMYDLIEKLEKDDFLYKRMEYYYSLISDSIKNNSNNFYSYDRANIAVNAFKEFFEARIRCVKKQLDSGLVNETIMYENTLNVNLLNEYYK